MFGKQHLTRLKLGDGIWKEVEHFGHYFVRFWGFQGKSQSSLIRLNNIFESTKKKEIL